MLTYFILNIIVGYVVVSILYSKEVIYNQEY